MDRCILHIDINNCYASIEQKLNPDLKGKAIAVGGSEKERRGIVLAKSEEAKKYGVKTGEPIWQAKQKCPELLIVKPHHDEYIKYSKIARELYYEYTNLVEPYGIDECWLDVTDSLGLFGSGENIAKDILNRMKEEIGLTVSIGVSFNKIFAKLGSDMKKPNAITIIKKEEFKEKIWKLSANELLMIGRKTNNKLKTFGITTIGDVANSNVNFMKTLLGKHGVEIWRYANGLDDSKVADATDIHVNKSISNGFTCKKNLHSREEIRTTLSLLSEKVSKRLIKDEVKCECVQIALKDFEFNIKQFQLTLSMPINNSIALLDNAMVLVDKNYKYEKPIRAVTLRANNLVSEDEVCQLDLFNSFHKNEKREKVDKIVCDINEKYHKNTVRLCSSINHTDIFSGNDHTGFFPTIHK